MQIKNFKSIAKEVIKIEINSLKKLQLSINKSFEQIVNAILNCKNGKIIISGVGKSGIVARKIAATFSSIGLMAIYLNPLDALHGDLGVVSQEDICLLLSNSGETLELLEILPHLKKRGNSCIALVALFIFILPEGGEYI